MKWKSLDYDCRNLFVNELSKIISEPEKWGFSMFFHHVKEYLDVSEKLSPKIIDILSSANEINPNSSKEDILSKIKTIFEDFKKLEM